jgi:hypothetical protein
MAMTKALPDYIRIVAGGRTEPKSPQPHRPFDPVSALSFRNYTDGIAELGRQQVIREIEARARKAKDAAPG